jgi:hypothetical protein
MSSNAQLCKGNDLHKTGWHLSIVAKSIEQDDVITGALRQAKKQKSHMVSLNCRK